VPSGPRSGGGGTLRTGRRFGGRGHGRSVEEPANATQARARAVGMLSRRDYPRAALKGRLTDAGFEAVAAESAVAELEDERLVNGHRYVEAAVASRIARGQGPIRIEMELRRLGVAPELVASAVNRRAPEWAERARAVQRRRFGAGEPVDSAARTRAMRFLLYRGFTGEQVRAALGRHAEALADDADLGADEEAMRENLSGEEPR
jgi:regulatory protein